MPTGPCNTCGKGSMCKVKIGTISGCSEWARMPQEARLAAGVSAQGTAEIPAKDGQGGGKAVKITLTGQIRGGKNNMIVLRNGMHIPKKEWKAWRDAMLTQVSGQFKGPKIETPCRAFVDYYAGDRKRRDVPAIMDSIWHVLERAGVVSDDFLICEIGGWSHTYDKANPRAIVRLEVLT